MEDNFQKIDQYLLATFNQEELKAFENELSKNPKLQAQVEAQRQAIQLLDLAGDQELKASLKKIHKSVIIKPVTPPRTLSRRLILWSSAAAVIIMLLTIYFLWPVNKNPQELYLAYFESYPISLSARSNENLNNAADRGSSAYFNKNYPAAISAFQEAQITDPDNTVYSLAIGLSYLELGQAESGLAYLQDLLDDPLYQNPAHWYLALAHLKMGDLVQCKELLNQISNSSPFYDAAQQLRRQLQ